MKPINIAIRQNNSKKKIKKEFNIMNRYSMDPTKNNENSNMEITTQKNSKLMNLTNINKSLFNKSAKNKTEKNTTLTGSINIQNRENKQNPTMLKSSFIAGGLFQDFFINKNKIFSEKKEKISEKSEKEEKNFEKNNRFYPIPNEKGNKPNSNNTKNLKSKASFDTHNKLNLNNFEKKLTEKEDKKKKAFSNNKTIANYINDYDDLNDSLDTKIKIFKTTSKRSESLNIIDYKSLDIKPNSKRTISQNMEDLSKK